MQWNFSPPFLADKVRERSALTFETISGSKHFYLYCFRPRRGKFDTPSPTLCTELENKCKVLNPPPFVHCT